MKAPTPPSVLKQAFHFPGLNGIRAIAASIVLLFHIDEFSELFGLHPLGLHKKGTADYGVVLFFVLSGYLITYLLLKEKEAYGGIRFKNFYIRRALRIWPVYYLTLIVTALLLVLAPDLLPHEHVAKTFTYYSLFLSNLGYVFGFGFITIYPLWSIGAEEQFYLFWPLLIDKSKKLVRTLLLFFIVFVAIKVSLRVFENGVYYSFISSTSFDCMAVGGMGAYLVSRKQPLLKYVYAVPVQLIAWAFFLFTILVRPVHISSLFDKEIHALFYAIIIINVSTNLSSVIKLENPVFNYLGKISYGIYVYHMTVLFLLNLLFKRLAFHLAPGYFSYTLVYISVVTLTILTAALSYYYFERPFLQFKGRFQSIKSRS